MQYVVLWTAIGALLTVTGYQLDSWEFWCFIGTYWAVGQLNRSMGNLEGLINFLSLSEQEQNKIRRSFEQISKDIK